MRCLAAFMPKAMPTAMSAFGRQAAMASWAAFCASPWRLTRWTMRMPRRVPSRL